MKFVGRSGIPLRSVMRGEVVKAWFCITGYVIFEWPLIGL